jgi:hypothetical protein
MSGPLTQTSPREAGAGEGEEGSLTSPSPLEFKRTGNRTRAHPSASLSDAERPVSEAQILS